MPFLLAKNHHSTKKNLLLITSHLFFLLFALTYIHEENSTFFSLTLLWNRCFMATIHPPPLCFCHAINLMCVHHRTADTQQQHPPTLKPFSKIFFQTSFPTIIITSYFIYMANFSSLLYRWAPVLACFFHYIWKMFYRFLAWS